MSFGFGVGDFIAVVRTADKIRKDFSGAPAQFQLIAAEVKNLALVTQDIDIFLAGHDVEADQERFLLESARSCHEVLSNVEKALSKYSTLESDAHGSKQRARRAWQRLKWEPDDIRDLRSALTSNLVVLNTFWETLNRNNIIRILDQQEELQNQAVLDWLADPDYVSQHHEFIQNRLPGTGEWLLNSPQYTRWVQTRGDYLYLHGIPGGGKSTLVSMIVEELRAISVTKLPVGVCYYYCAFGRGQDQTPAKVLMCLLRQLAQSHPKTPPCLEALYSKHSPNQTVPGLEELDEMFKTLTQSLSMVYIIIDALDEFDNINMHRGTLIKEILELRKMLNANILLTSRSIPLIINEISGMETLTIRADDQDVKSYIRNHLAELPRFVSTLPDLQSEIENAIAHAADGMFLLAKLHLDSLRYKRSPRELRKGLPAPGKVENAYAKAYKKTLSVICSQHPDYRDLAMDALGWIVHAKRHLRAAELLHILALEIDESEFHHDNTPDIRDVIAASCGLIVLESGSDFVHVVHKTAQDFLATSPWLNDAKVRMGKACVAYLSLSHFASGPSPTLKEFLQRLADYRFYSYASRYWGSHIPNPEADPTVQEFLEKQQHVQASYQVLAYDRRGRRRWNSPMAGVPGFKGLHLAAVLGLSAIISASLNNGVPMLDDDCARGPLSYAAGAGHESIVKLLVADNMEADKPDTNGRTPLSYAAENGHTKIVSLLITCGVRIDYTDEMQKSPLSYAAKWGNTDVVSILLQQNAQHNVADVNLRTPLMHAAYGGHVAVVDLLLAKDGDIDQRNDEGQTALSEAAKGGHNDVATLILAHGATVDTQDANNCTPLFLAVAAGHIEMVTMLIRANAQVDLPNALGQTPLSRAAEHSELDIVSLLFDYGAGLNCKNSSDATPLYHAVNQENYDVAIYLLEHGADPTTGNTGGWTVLHLAAARGNLEILEVLLESEQRGDARAAVEQQANHSRKNGSIDSTEGGIPRSTKKYGTNSNKIQSRLDVEGRSALHLAVASNQLDAMQYLVKSGSDVDLRDKRAKGLLEHACCSGNSEIMTMVLEEFGLSRPHPHASETWSPLHWACLRGDLAMIKQLLHAGVKYSTVATNEPNVEWSPLDVAIYYSNTKLVSGGDGSLHEQHTWIDLIGAGLVEFDEKSEKIVPVRRNNLSPAVKVFYGSCDGCLQDIRGYRFRCRQCREFDYCFMCKHDSHLTHPDHQWVVENPEDLVTEALARPYSNLSLMSASRPFSNMSLTSVSRPYSNLSLVDLSNEA